LDDVSSSELADAILANQVSQNAADIAKELDIDQEIVEAAIGSVVGTGADTGASDLPATTDLGNGLFAVENGDGTQSVFTDDGSFMGTTGGEVQDWEGNRVLTGIPNVTIQSLPGSGISDVNEIHYFPEGAEQIQKYNDYINSLSAGEYLTSGGADLSGTYDFRNDDFGGGYGGGGGGYGGGKFLDMYDTAAYAAGGMPTYAGGGLGSLQSNLGGYSDGGRLLRGPGDGVSDSIPATIGKHKQPARLADGEFVIPARIVSELGNGSTEAGSRKLYAMMDRIQKSRGKTVGKGKVAANSRADKHLPA
jgi:hypothetical protein